jgi:hypothetical protein
MRTLKKIICVILCFFIITKDFMGFEHRILADELDADSRQLIETLVYYEDNKMWDEYPEIWVNQEKEIFRNLFSDEEYFLENKGVSNIESAKLVSLEIQNNSNVDKYINEYKDIYENVSVYLAGIDYSVSEVSKSFYNGVNYRIILTGMEDDKLKIISVSEAPEELLSGSEEESKQLAVAVIDKRKEGYIVDGDLSLAGSYIHEYSETIDDTISSIGTLGYNSGYNYNTKFDLYLPNEINLYRVDDGCTEKLSMPIYTKRVLSCEMTISTSGLEALKAQVICIQQYAAWNILYYSKYPNQGYDLKDTTADQVYCDNANCTKHKNRVYDGLDDLYRTKADSAYAAVGNICMIIKSSGALFESRYCEDKTYNTDADPKMYQKGAIELAANGKTCFEILRAYYNCMHYPSYNNTLQYIEFRACYK